MKGRDSKRSTERKRGKKTANSTSRPTTASARPGATLPEATPLRPQDRAPRSPQGKRSQPAARTERHREPDTATSPATEARGDKSESFPVVGIGASAGGLEALEQFFKHVPEHSGMAFVVITHLDPTHKGMMVELLQRTTSIPVVQIEDRLKIERNHVYVIPPAKDLSILHGALYLQPQTSARGLNLPIDFFFRSLADDQHESGVGVVLSGMGSDGTLGLRAIKEKAGAGFVQDPASAKFDSMPRCAIDAGLADVVAPVEELPGKIVAYCQHALSVAKPDAPVQEKTQSALDKVFVLLRTHTGSDFSQYKDSTIHRRIERRMGFRQIDKLESYVRFLSENPGETQLLFKELLIGVTSFFRDPLAWEQLKNEIMPELVSAHPKGGAIRAWVPGCSTGEEAYSLAIVFNETLARLKSVNNVTMQIFATDLDREAVEKARSSVFSAKIADDVSPEQLSRFFVQHERGYRVVKEVREMVVFAPQNVIMDPPFTRLDILSCRNLLIYLSSDLKKKLIALFHYCLNPGGILFLGSAETPGVFSDLFSTLEGKARFFRRREGSSVDAALVDFPSLYAPPARGGVAEPKQEAPVTPKTPPANLQTLADEVVIRHISPPVVFTNDKGDIVYTSGRTGKYLEPAVGKTNVNVFAMAREGLRDSLLRVFSAALNDEQPAIVRGVQVGSHGGTQTVDLTVQKLTEPRELQGTMMIVFADVANASVRTSAPIALTTGEKTSSIPTTVTRLAELEKDLKLAHEELQASREKMQTWKEEFQSTNEELQSTNEELTSSKEEAQSMNEELQTVNTELQAKVTELSQSSNDMANLLNSTDIATLFLDRELRVGRFTPQTTKIIKLIPGDAGRPFTDINTCLDYPELADDAREVLRTLLFKEKMVPANDKRWFSVRIMPYRTQDNVIDGLVLTFTDASTSKALEAALRKEEAELRNLADSLPQLVWSSRADGAFDYLSRQWIDYTGVPEPEQVGNRWLQHVSPDDRERVRSEWTAAISSGGSFDSEFRIRSSSGAYRWFKARAAPIRDEQGMVVKWYGTGTDIHDSKPAEEARRQLSEKTTSILESTSDAVFSLDLNLSMTYSNPAAERLLGRKRADALGKPLFDVLPEAGGAICDKKYRQALADQIPVAFEMRLDAAPNEGWYGVRVFPQEGCLSVFIQKREAATAVGDLGSGQGRWTHMPGGVLKDSAGPAGPSHPSVVAIGASAGGLAAFQTLIGRLPTDTGMAFVLLSHILRGSESLLPEILSRSTTMAVVEVADREQILPNHIYVLPPDRYMEIDGDFLRLVRRPDKDVNSAIDHFLLSLAGDQARSSIGIILSGEGSDGAEGLKVLKEMGGLTMAQTPATASSQAMPTNAIEIDHVDHILSPEEIADRLGSREWRDSQIGKNRLKILWVSKWANTQKR